MRPKTLTTAATALTLYGLMDGLRRSDYAWDTAGHSKRRWLAAQAVLPPVASLAYLTRIRPRLNAAQEGLRLQGG